MGLPLKLGPGSLNGTFQVAHLEPDLANKILNT